MSSRRAAVVQSTAAPNQLAVGEGEREEEGPLKNAEWSQLWRTMHVAVIGAFHSDTPLPSQHSHAALTQRVAVNLAWRKHGFKLNEGSDIATPLGRECSQSKRNLTNMEITERQHDMVYKRKRKLRTLSVYWS